MPGATPTRLGRASRAPGDRSRRDGACSFDAHRAVRSSIARPLIAGGSGSDADGDSEPSRRAGDYGWSGVARYQAIQQPAHATATAIAVTPTSGRTRSVMIAAPAAITANSARANWACHCQESL